MPTYIHILCVIQSLTRVYQKFNIQLNPLLTVVWGLKKNDVNCKKCKNNKLIPSLECSANNIGKLMNNVLTFLQHIIPTN
jgi:hypothetical protein